MKGYLIHQVTAAALVGVAAAITGALTADAQTGSVDDTMTTEGPTPKLELTPAQRSAIYQEVHNDRSKATPRRFTPTVGADVPPMIELYMLPDDILASNPATKFYKFTRVDEHVVLVDPTRMRVVAVIGPQQGE
jgi:hypothetical protein